MEIDEDNGSGLNYLTFNQDYSCVCCGTKSGFVIYTLSPTIKQAYEWKGVGCSIVEMLFTTSLVAWVAKGDEYLKLPPAAKQQQQQQSSSSSSSAITDDRAHVHCSPRRVLLCNIETNKLLMSLNYVTPVLAVRLNQQRLVVVLETKIHIYDILSVKLLHTIDTLPNPKGLCELSKGDENLLVYPKDGNGQDNAQGKIAIFDCSNFVFKEVFEAHISTISCFALSHNSRLLATVSEKGTIIRIFNLQKKLASNEQRKAIQEFRRGSYSAVVSSLSFSKDMSLLSAASLNGTIHIFSVNLKAEKGYVGSMLPTVLGDAWNPQRAAVTIKMDQSLPYCNSKMIASIYNNSNKVVALTGTGHFLQFEMDMPNATGQLQFSVPLHQPDAENEGMMESTFY